jgi:hypothetical protein
MIYGDDQYLKARMNELEEIIIEPTEQFKEMISDIIRDIEILGDRVCDLQDEIRELKEARDYENL